MSHTKLLTQIRDLFIFTDDGHILYKRKTGHHAVGSRADQLLHKSRGYRITYLNGKSYPAHRLVFLNHFEYLPPYIEHINWDKQDNKINNLKALNTSPNSPSNRKDRSAYDDWALKHGTKCE